MEPAGVVVPRTREDVVRTVEIAARHQRLDHRARRRHVAGRPGDRDGPAARYLEVSEPGPRSERRRALGLDRAGRRARRAQRQLRPHGLRFAPDISTASRATVGGMISNNSSGARSVLYGKTIDHVLELHVVLADGSTAHFRPLDTWALDAACAGDTLEARCYRTVRQLAADSRDEIDRRFPKVLRRVGGYNLDEFVDPLEALQPRQAGGRLRGHARPRRGGEDRPRAAAGGQGGADDRIRHAARRARRDAAHPAPRPVGGRGDGPVHPRPCEGERRARRAAKEHPADRSGRAALRRNVRRPRRGSAAAARGARARPCRIGFHVPLAPRRSPPRTRRRSGAFGNRPSACRWR